MGPNLGVDQTNLNTKIYGKLGGGFIFFKFAPLLGEDSHFDEHIFQLGWFNHQLVNL